MARKLRIISSLLFGTTIFAIAVAGCGDIEETERRGNAILGALERFNSDHGRYPAALDELQPKYLQEIPTPTWGLRTWKYSSDGAEFQIGVDESTRTGGGDALWFRYLGEKHGWQTGD